MMAIVQRMGIEEDEAIQTRMITRSIENAQKKVEGKNFGIRKYVLQYDNVMNKQREIIYGERKKVLLGENLRDYIENMTDELIENIITPITLDSKYPEEWNFDVMVRNLRQISARFGGIDTSKESLANMDGENLVKAVQEKFYEIYNDHEAEIGEDRMRELERMILLKVVDSKWMDHIDAMEQLKSGIGLRGIGQQDPAAAYAKEGFDMFDEMIASIKEDTVKFCYNVTLDTSSERKDVIGKGEEKKEDVSDIEREFMTEQMGMSVHAVEEYEEEEQKREPIQREHPKVGRNDPCPCGSGKKYKHCHGR